MICPIIELTQQLIRRPSLSPNDAGCQALIIKRLRSIGFTIESMDIDDTQNFWAWRGRDQAETLVFAGHTDVVSVGKADYWISPPFEPTIRDGMLFGRGAADMKGSLAAMVVAAERFVAQHPKHKNRLAFLITSDEEASAKNGTIKVVESLMARNERLDYCLVGEPSSTKIVGDVVKNGRRGSLNCSLMIHSIEGHVAYSHLAENPVHRAIPMLDELVSIQWDRGNKFFPPTTMQIVNVQAGTGDNNVIPGELFVQFNFRFGTELTDKIIKTRVEALLKKYQLCYTIDWLVSGWPFLTRCGRLMDVVVSTINYYNGIKPQLLTTGGTSDGRFIALMGAQIIELGLVNSTIHKINECVNVDDLQLLARMYQCIMEKLVA